MIHPNLLDQQIDNLRTLQASYDQLASDVQALKDAHVLGFSYDGIIFEEGYEPRGAFGIIAERDRIIEVHDNKDTFVPEMSAADYPELKVFEMRGATVLPPGWMAGSSSLLKAIIPNVTTGGISYWSQLMYNVSSIEYLDIQNLNFIPYANGTYTLVGNVRLIDIIYGSALTASSDLLRNWNPSYVLVTNPNGNDLVATEGVQTNREQLLYNIREHIAANLIDRTGLSPLTITFNQTLRNAFDQATEDAFAAKNWDIAPARS